MNAGSQVDALVGAALSKGSGVAGEADLEFKQQEFKWPKFQARPEAEVQPKDETEPAYQPRQEASTSSYQPKERTKEDDQKEKKFTIISNNIATLAPKVEQVLGWEADVLAFQETRLSSLMQLKITAKMSDEGWQPFLGKAMQVQTTANKVASATNAAKGGVALVAKSGVPIKKAPHNADIAILRDQARWEEILHAIGKGDRHLRIATLYGYDGASGDAQRFRLNEDHISRALIRMLEQGDTPYIICGDFNISPQQSPAIAGLIAKRVLVDVPSIFGYDEQHTFSTDGTPLKGVEGKGRTRIDTILANKVAFPMIVECNLRWDLCISDHVPLEVVLDLQRYGAEIIAPNMEPPFPEMQWHPKDKRQKEHHRDEAWNQAWSEVEARFSKAENYHNIEAMHALWCKAAVAMLKEVTEVQHDNKYRKAARRAQIARFCKRTTQTPADSEGTPTTCWIRRLKTEP